MKERDQIRESISDNPDTELTERERERERERRET